MKHLSAVIRFGFHLMLLSGGVMCGAADWRYYAATLQSAPGDGKSKAYFYDKDSIRKLHNGHTMLWTQSVVVEQAPDADKSRRDVSIAAYEQGLNALTLKPSAKVYYEIDCTWKKLRALGELVYRADGSEENHTQMAPYVPMAASPVLEGLGRLVCAP